MSTLINFLRDDDGQDLVEYTMLLAFVALASGAILIGTANSLSTVWSDGSLVVSQAASAAVAGTS